MFSRHQAMMSSAETCPLYASRSTTTALTVSPRYASLAEMMQAS